MSEIHFVGKTRYEDLRETETETVSCHRLLRMARSDKEKNVKTKANFVNFQNAIPAKITIKATLMKLINNIFFLYHSIPTAIL